MNCDFSEYTLPKEFRMFINYVKKLKYEDKPDYPNIYKLFERMRKEQHFSAPSKTSLWEWNKKFLTFSNVSGYNKLNSLFNKLYDGYPVPAFEEYIKKLVKISKMDGDKITSLKDIKDIGGDLKDEDGYCYDIKEDSEDDS